MSLRDLILGAKDTSLKKVEVSEWQTEVWVKSWTAAERSQFLGWVEQAKAGNSHDYLTRLFVMSVADESGKRLFTEADLPALQEKNGAAIQRVAEAALHHNAVSGQAVDEAKNA